MGKLLKVLSAGVGVLVAVVIIAAAAVAIIYNSRANKVYAVTPAAVVIPTEAAALERGRHLVEAVSDCVGCHGPDLSGGPVIDDPALGTIYARNLTTGQGGVDPARTDAEWVLAIRHGLRTDGRSLLIMPSYDYHHLDDADLGAIIAYLKTVPPVDHAIPAPTLLPLGMVLTVLNALPTFTAELVDQTPVVPAAPAAGVTIDYGRYLVSIAGCAGCHQADLAGGAVPGSGPDDPQAANLTPAGELGQWTTAMFITTLRTGIKPSGTPLGGDMPWPAYAQMTDDELTAVFMYLQTVPAVSR